MSYTLISSERSPFGRICRMFLINHKIKFDFRILNFVDNKQDAEALSKESPINKVPILIDGKEKIFDSRVIMNYLIKKHDLPELSVEEENIVSAIYSCLDVSVTLFLMRFNGYDLNAENHYLQRQKERIPRNLEYIKPWAMRLNNENPAHWNFPAMSLMSFLYWGEARAKTIQLSDYPHFKNFIERFQNQPGVAETHLPK